MKVLIDTNVIIDFFCKRKEFYEHSASIFDKAVSGEIEIYASPISFVNFFYITRKDYTVEQRYDILRSLLGICKITPTTENVIHNAISTEMPDFEDMVQLYSAKCSSVDCIITRNVKDFSSSDIPVFTPSQFLSK